MACEPPSSSIGRWYAAIFRAYVETVLAPELRPGDIVVMDNLSSHKAPGVAEAIQARGAEVRYLPPYSPDLNPIEQFFSKLKAILPPRRGTNARRSLALHRRRSQSPHPRRS